jgi:hypothetical protein
MAYWRMIAKVTGRDVWERGAHDGAALTRGLLILSQIALLLRRLDRSQLFDTP